MSVKVSGLVWDHFPKGGGHFLTALALADHAHHDGTEIWPSIKTLATMTQQSERTIQYHIQYMLKTGWLVLVRPGGRGSRRTPTYRMPIERITPDVVGRVQNLHPQKPAETYPQSYPQGCKLGVHGVQNGVKRGASIVAPELRTVIKKKTVLERSNSTPHAPVRLGEPVAISKVISACKAQIAKKKP